MFASAHVIKFENVQINLEYYVSQSESINIRNFY